MKGGNQQQLNLPAGFRFHPTDEELVVHYLCRKCAGQRIAVPIIAEIDLYKFDPWQLPERPWRQPHLRMVLTPSNSLSRDHILIINPPNQINSVKLSDDNFLLRNLQILAGIHGLGIDIFILNDPPVPPKVVIDEHGTEMVNPAFISWCRQDQLLFPFLHASMTEGVQSQMIGCLTSVQLWTRVSCLFATRSRAKVMQYKLQLQTLKKGNLSMKDYLGKMKNLMDILAACGHPLSDEDQVLYILGGVGLEYDSIVVHVTSRVESLTIFDVGLDIRSLTKILFLGFR